MTPLLVESTARAGVLPPQLTAAPLSVGCHRGTRWHSPTNQAWRAHSRCPRNHCGAKAPGRIERSGPSVRFLNEEPTNFRMCGLSALFYGELTCRSPFMRGMSHSSRNSDTGREGFSTSCRRAHEEPLREGTVRDCDRRCNHMLSRAWSLRYQEKSCSRALPRIATTAGFLIFRSAVIA
jgi:hypothetical protein